MRSILVTLALVGCGSTTRPGPVVVAKAAPVAPPQATSCADAGVLLRGPVEYELDRPEGGPARAAAIAKACEDGKWSAAILHCVADSTEPAPCLDKLDEAQRELYDQGLVAWAEAFAGDEPVDEPTDAYVDCDDGIGDVAMYAPAITLGGGDAEFAIAMRRHEVVRLCNAQSWETLVRQCLQTATDPQGIAACEAKLPPDHVSALAARLDELDKLVATTFEKRKKPLDCKRVVALHYGDAAWKGKLDGLKPVDRKKVIADSRAQMTKACTIEAWDPTLRSCVVVGGEGMCFPMTAYLWGFPATGVYATSTGIAECDKYIETMNRTMTCQKLSQASRDAFKESFTAMREAVTQLKTTDDATKKAMGESCRFAAEALQQVLSGSGC